MRKEATKRALALFVALVMSLGVISTAFADILDYTNGYSQHDGYPNGDTASIYPPPNDHASDDYQPDDYTSNDYTTDYAPNNYDNSVIAHVLVFPEYAELQPGDTQLFFTMLFDNHDLPYFGYSDYSVVWTLEGEESDYTVVDGGLLSICDYEESDLLIVTATVYVEGYAVVAASSVVFLDDVADDDYYDDDGYGYDDDDSYDDYYDDGYDDDDYVDDYDDYVDDYDDCDDDDDYGIMGLYIGIAPAALLPGQLGVLWSMQTDPGVQNIPLGTAFTPGGTSIGVDTPIMTSGDVTVTTVANPTAGADVSLQVTGRNADWHGIQIRYADLEALGMNLELHSYTINITGRRTTPLGAGTAVMQLRGNTGPWANMAASPAVAATDGAGFTINWAIVPATLRSDAAPHPFRDFRIQSAHTSTAFIIDTITITRTGVLPASFTLSSNGQSGVATTSEITINFSRDVAAPDLTLTDITFGAGATGATATSLQRINASQYILHIAGAIRWGGVTVAISHADVATGSQPTTLYHQDFVIDLRPNAPLRPYFPWVNDPGFVGQLPLTEYFNDPFTFFWHVMGAPRPAGRYIQVANPAFVPASTLPTLPAALGGGANPHYNANPAPRYLSVFVEYPANGMVTTPYHWELRRLEIRDLLMYYVYGYVWPTTTANVTVNLTGAQATAATGTGPTATRTIGPISITVNETRRDGSPTTATFTAGTLTLPSWQQLFDNGFWNGPAQHYGGIGGPVIMGAFGGQTAALLNARGIGVITGVPAGNPGTVYQQLFPHNATITQYNNGLLARQAWNLSRMIDVIELNPQFGVNYNAISTTGSSIAGKNAMAPGVFDHRVAITAPHESGGDGGVAPFRYNHAGRIHFYHHDTLDIQNTNRVHAAHELPRTGPGGTGNDVRFTRGATGAFLRGNTPFVDSMYRLPVDTHLAIAMTAPTMANPNRAFLALETTNFGVWTGWSPAVTVADAAREVFQFLGRDNLVYIMKNSNHASSGPDFITYLAIVDYLFGRPVHGTSTGFRGNRQANQVYVESLTLGGGGAAAARPATYPGIWNGLHYLSRTPIEVSSYMIPWARPGVHAIWTDVLHVTEGFPTTIVAHTSAPDGATVALILREQGDMNRLRSVRMGILPVEIDRWTATVANGQAIFDLSAADVQIGRYELVVQGSPSRSAFFQGIDVHTALISGITGDQTGGGRQIGFTSRIVNPQNIRLHEVSAAGATSPQLSSQTWQQGGQNWISPFGVRWGAAIGGAGTERAYTIRGLQMEAMPGFTFEMSFQATIHAGGNGQMPSIWQPSQSVATIGPYPYWRSAGNSPDWGNALGSTNTPWPLRTTTFPYDPDDFVHELYDNEWTITFPGPINIRDFGIGFNHDEFSLAWSAGNTVLTITFDNLSSGQELDMYINRIRSGADTGGTIVGSGAPNVATQNAWFNTYIHYALTAAIITQTVTFTADTNGSIEATVDGNDITSGDDVPEGETVIFTVTPDTGYRVLEWTITGGTLSGINADLTREVVIGDEPIVVEVTFEEIPDDTQYVTFTAGANGSIAATVGGTAIASGDDVTEGSTVVFEATPASGYRVLAWTITGGTLSGNATDVSRYVVVGAEAVVVNVTFEEIPDDTQYVTFTAGANGSIAATVGGIAIASGDDVVEGSTVVFTATPANGYRVLAWTITGGTLSGAANAVTRNAVVGTSAITVNVTFEPIPVIPPQNGGGGQGGGQNGGGGGQPQPPVTPPTPSTPPAPPIPPEEPTDDTDLTYVANPSDPNNVNDVAEGQLNNGDDNVTLTLPEGETNVVIDEGTLGAIVDGDADLTIITDDATVTISTPGLADIANQGGGTVDIGVRTETTDTGVVVSVSMASDGEEIRSIAAPANVAVNIGNIANNLNPYRFVAVSADGTLVGGGINTATGQFMFRTAVTGDFTIVYVETLRRLRLQIDSYLIIDLAENASIQVMDVVPTVISGRTLIPVRFLANALGADTNWNSATRQVTLTMDGESLTFAMGELAPGMDVPAQAINGRTMVPLRFASDFFGAIITWDSETRIIEVLL